MQHIRAIVVPMSAFGLDTIVARGHLGCEVAHQHAKMIAAIWLHVPPAGRVGMVSTVCTIRLLVG